jgi:hypothetical protein
MWGLVAAFTRQVVKETMNKKRISNLKPCGLKNFARLHSAFGGLAGWAS